MAVALFGVLNRAVFYPVFNFLKGFIGNYGLIIILMTIVTRIILSPVLYKSYLSSAKMKVLRPEMLEINEKYPGKENGMKRQQETMALQRKAGVNPLSGCIPALNYRTIAELKKAIGELKKAKTPKGAFGSKIIGNKSM